MVGEPCCEGSACLPYPWDGSRDNFCQYIARLKEGQFCGVRRLAKINDIKEEQGYNYYFNLSSITDVGSNTDVGAVSKQAQESLAAAMSLSGIITS